MTNVRKGFTLVEMLIALTIIGLLTTVSVVQFQSGRYDDALRNATLRISDALRTAQSSALSGTLEQYQDAPRYGLYAFKVSAGASCMNGSATVNEGLVLFADINDDGLYTASIDSAIRCISFDVDAMHAIVLDEIKETKAADGTTTLPASATAAFRRPTASVTVDGDIVMKNLIITLKNTKNNHTKEVALDRISGRVDVEY